MNELSKIGGIIAAANMKVSQPLKMAGTLPIIKRIIITYRQVGIFPIVVVVNSVDYEIKYQLADSNVIFIESGEHDGNLKVIESAKLGFRYLQNKSQRVFFTTVNIPLVLPDTLRRMMSAPGKIVIPSMNNRSGHPVLLDTSIIPEILEYNGDDGLRGALKEASVPRSWIEVDDPGIFTNIKNEDQVLSQLPAHNAAILRPTIQLGIGREDRFFNSRLKLLLFLISDTNNVRKASDMMAVSYAKAWSMINHLEEELGYTVVERRQGGRNGGKTRLTERGMQFLEAYQNFEEEVIRNTQRCFDNQFKKII